VKKICIKCKSELPADLAHFYSNYQNKDGLEGKCMECKREYQKARRGSCKKKTREPLIVWSKVMAAKLPTEY